MVKICNSSFPTDSIYNEYFEKYSYPLSDFQKYSIEGIIEGNHILVTAHTGSGKTLPALFAIDYFTKMGKKLIYTTPIKALSNQKYWEFSQKFPSISFGLLTGDIKTNPTADVLIMTTEILMNYLFRKDNSVCDFEINIETELGCVVFDEVHYINDVARGHVWEQTILMLPTHIQMIMLSATIDNPVKFGEWIESKSSSSSKNVWLCSTDTRVVPLTHYSFMTVHEGLFKLIKDDSIKQEIRNHTNKLITIKSEKGVFSETNYFQIKKMLTLFENKQQFIKRKFAINALMKFLKDREMLPAIVFVFSRKQVEILAQDITTNLLEDDSKIPYTVSHECEQILRNKITNFREYLELSEYITLVKLLEKGIGIHHSGMIPILREIVEMFILKKYIKLLIATESFAIGLDCPIKTAVFISLTKYDGNQMRLLESHEYSQMSGRAGRRGIDTIGNVIHCNNLFLIPPMIEYREILCGKPQKLESKFQISYSMILSLLCTNGGTIQFSEIKNFIKKSMSFRETQSSLNNIQKNISTIEENIKKKNEFLNLLKTPIEIMEKYISLKNGLEMASTKKRKEITRELSSYLEQYKFLEKDLISFTEREKLEKELKDEMKHLKYVENYVEIQIMNVISIMKKFGFVTQINEEIQYTELGKLASQFAEVHPLVFSKIIYNNGLKNLSTKEIVGLLSCFTDIKIDTDEKVMVVEKTGLKETILKMKEFYDELEKEELDNMNKVMHMNELLMYDLIDLSMEWCECLDETSCKYFIQEKVLGEKKISIGDFTKAILKIVTIIHEIQKATVDVELLYKCSLIEPMILKYITTSQSLYI